MGFFRILGEFTLNSIYYFESVKRKVVMHKSEYRIVYLVGILRRNGHERRKITKENELGRKKER